MFRIIFLISLLVSTNIFANFNLSINDLCTDKDILKLNVNSVNISLGDLMIEQLEKNKILYNGSKYGITSIQNSPTSDDALIVLSDYEMLAFGWCYKIDGEISEKMPDEIMIDSNIKSIRWFYGFAHYLKGEWISQCAENRDIVKKTFCR